MTDRPRYRHSCPLAGRLYQFQRFPLRKTPRFSRRNRPQFLLPKGWSWQHLERSLPREGYWPQWRLPIGRLSRLQWPGTIRHVLFSHLYPLSVCSILLCFFVLMHGKNPKILFLYIVCQLFEDAFRLFIKEWLPAKDLIFQSV